MTRSAVGEEQRAFLLEREADGFAVTVARGWDVAFDFFVAYMAGTHRPDPPDAWWR